MALKPISDNTIHLKSSREIEIMREAGQIVAQTCLELKRVAEPGMGQGEGEQQRPIAAAIPFRYLEDRAIFPAPQMDPRPTEGDLIGKVQAGRGAGPRAPPVSMHHGRDRLGPRSSSKES